ncbi:MAG: hypothetical protein ACOCX0_03935 [Bacteroidota bacterium]
MEKLDLKTRIEHAIQNWTREIEEFEKSSGSLPKTKGKPDPRRKELEEKIAKAKSKSAEIDATPADQWEKLKDGFSQAMNDLFK